MANYERDARSDDVRVFDGGEDEEDVEGSRLPLLIVIALLVLAAFGAVVWLAYQRGVQQGHSEVPYTIVAQAGPARVAPPEAGGTPTPYTGLKIYQQPAPSDDEADTADAVPPPPTEIPPVAKPTTMASTVPAATPPSAAAPATPPSVKTAPLQPAPAKPVQPAAATPAPTIPAPTPPVATPEPASGSVLLQICSYKSQAEANAAWATYKGKYPLVAGLSPDIKQVDLGAKGTWYRLRIGAASRAEATSLCDTLKAQGGACIPTK